MLHGTHTHRFYIFSIIFAAFFSIPNLAIANVPVDVGVNNGSTANLTISIIIGDPPDTETTTDSQMYLLAAEVI